MHPQCTYSAHALHMHCTCTAHALHMHCTYVAHVCTCMCMCMCMCVHMCAACIEFIKWQHSASTLMSECFSTSGRASWIFCITLGGRPICIVLKDAPLARPTMPPPPLRPLTPCCAEQPGAKLHGLRRLGWGWQGIWLRNMLRCPADAEADAISRGRQRLIALGQLGA